MTFTDVFSSTNIRTFCRDPLESSKEEQGAQIWQQVCPILWAPWGVGSSKNFPSP